MLQSTLEIFETQDLEWGGGGHKFCKITFADSTQAGMLSSYVFHISFFIIFFKKINIT
jgi:hypothetical protein